jgi:hypothetical protein
VNLITKASAAALLVITLGGCGVVQRQQQQAAIEGQRQRYAAGQEDCKAKFPTTRTSKNHADFARCIVDLENTDPPIGAYPDLIRLKQSYYILVATKIDQGTLSVEEANVQNAQIRTQLESEAQRRQMASRMVGAQEQAAEAQRQAAFAQTLSAVAASMPKSPPPPQAVNCTTTGPYSMRTTNCF